MQIGGRSRFPEVGFVMVGMAAMAVGVLGFVSSSDGGARAGRGAPSAAPPPAVTPVTPERAARTVFVNGCAPEMTRVGKGCVDRFEASLLVRGSDGSLTPYPPHLRPTGAFFVAESKAGVKPQAYISRNEAAAACENAGKRLCSLDEWYAACRGSRDTLYPYGEKFEPKRCNVAKPHLLSILFGKDPSRWLYDEHFNNPVLNQRPGFLSETAAHEGCATPEGAFDMVGNLHEWVSDRVDASLSRKVPLTAGMRRRLPSNAGKGVFMGGFFSTLNQHGEGCSFTTAAHEPSYHDYSTGFRCCADAR